MGAPRAKPYGPGQNFHLHGERSPARVLLRRPAPSSKRKEPDDASSEPRSPRCDHARSRRGLGLRQLRRPANGGGHQPDGGGGHTTGTVSGTTSTSARAAAAGATCSPAPTRPRPRSSPARAPCSLLRRSSRSSSATTTRPRRPRSRPSSPWSAGRATGRRSSRVRRGPGRRHGARRAHGDGDRAARRQRDPDLALGQAQRGRPRVPRRGREHRLLDQLPEPRHHRHGGPGARRPDQELPDLRRLPQQPHARRQPR